MPWRNHYQRLHLHTVKNLSHLPYRKFEVHIAQYPSRQDVVDYLDNYLQSLVIKPLYHTEAVDVKKDENGWITETSKGTFQSHYLIVATGAYNQPKTFHCTGSDTFKGQILHSSQYHTGKDFQNKKVLVIGFGNSACEIAIDLYEQGAHPSLSVRSAVNVVPRDLLGISIQYYSWLLSKFPPRIADALIAPIMKWKYGNFLKYGLQKAKAGVFARIKKGVVPVLDIGTMQYIRNGTIAVFAGIHHIQANTVYFNDGKQETFDAIVAAIGYEKEAPAFLNLFSKHSVEQQEKEGLYTCGFSITSTGLIRQIAYDAKRIAKEIAKKKRISH